MPKLAAVPKAVSVALHPVASGSHGASEAAPDAGAKRSPAFVKVNALSAARAPMFSRENATANSEAFLSMIWDGLASSANGETREAEQGERARCGFRHENARRIRSTERAHFTRGQFAVHERDAI